MTGGFVRVVQARMEIEAARQGSVAHAEMGCYGVKVWEGLAQGCSQFHGWVKVKSGKISKGQGSVFVLFLFFFLLFFLVAFVVVFFHYVTSLLVFNFIQEHLTNEARCGLYLSHCWY